MQQLRGVSAKKAEQCPEPSVSQNLTPEVLLKYLRIVREMGFSARKWWFSTFGSATSEFKYLRILFMNEIRMEQEIDRQIGVVSLFWTIVVKRELIWKAKLSIYELIYIQTLRYGHELCVMTERTSLQIQEAKMSFPVELLLIRIERSHLWWFQLLIRMPPGHLPLEVFWAHAASRRPQGRSRTCWRDYISHLY